MPLVPAAPPQPVPIIYSGFDYVAVDAERRRVYAAHTGGRALLVVNADTGAVLGQVRVGLVAGVAVDPTNGHVYTGNSLYRTISEVDPATMKVVRSVDVDGIVDAVAYDSALHRLYADEDDGTRIFVIDTQTMKQVGTVPLPGHKPEFLAIDPATHKIYQNIDTLNEFVIIDPQTLSVIQTVPTPELEHNHPLQIDAQLGHVYVAGVNGALSVYDLNGKRLSTIKFDGAVDQCSLDATRHNLGCAGGGGLKVFNDSGQTMTLVDTVQIAQGVHTVGADQQTGHFWAVWASPQGDFVQSFKLKP
jgi:DNA-binding beta-propeller fold protein YncE